MGAAIQRLAAAGAFVALAAPPVGHAAPPPPVSAVQQYVEMLPTASGPSAVGRGSSRAPLSRAAKHALTTLPAADAAALTTLATSAAAGAPTGASPAHA